MPPKRTTVAQRINTLKRKRCPLTGHWIADEGDEEKECVISDPILENFGEEIIDKDRYSEAGDDLLFKQKNRHQSIEPTSSSKHNGL